jgi:DNA sulfur modification protein DndD
MDLDYVQMKNFRQYLDTRIEFARDPSKNFTIIQGVNGSGKTNLLNAITWCLFGEEFHIDRKYAGLPIVNTVVLDKSEDELLEMKVEIQFMLDDKNKMVVTRTGHFKKGKDGTAKEIPDPHSLTVMQMQGREWLEPIYGSDAQYAINNRVPPDIEEYFFFDGERMDEYFKESTGKDIRKAVFEISQLELFERLIDHLTIRRNDFLKTSRGLSSRAHELNEFLELHTKSLGTDNEVLEESKQKKRRSRKERERIQ